MKKILLAILVIGALYASWFVWYQYMGTFIRGDFSSFGQEYDPHEKRIAEFFELRTQTYRYRIPEGKKMILSMTRKVKGEDSSPGRYEDEDLPDRFKRDALNTVVGEGFWGTRGRLTIHEYVDHSRNEYVFDIRNIIETKNSGKNVSWRFRFDLDRWNGVDVALGGVVYSSTPRIGWDSYNRASLIERWRFKENPLEGQASSMNNLEKQEKLSEFEPDLFFEVAAILEEVDESL